MLNITVFITCKILCSLTFDIQYYTITFNKDLNSVYISVTF